MKRVVIAVATAAIASLGWAESVLGQALTAYRDAQGHLYFDGFRRNAEIFLRLQYTANTASASNRYQAVWMYPRPGLSCQIHQLFNTRRKFQFMNQVTIRNATPADVTFLLSGGTAAQRLVNVGSNPVLCNGSSFNPALQWRVVNGIRAVRATDPCFRRITNRNTNQPMCIPEDMIYIAGLPGPSYRAITPFAKQRMLKSNRCGFVKVPNSSEWAAFANDVITLSTRYDSDHPDYRFYGNFTRANLPIRPFNQIPKCFDGRRFLPAP